MLPHQAAGTQVGPCRCKGHMDDLTRQESTEPPWASKQTGLPKSPMGREDPGDESSKQ